MENSITFGVQGPNTIHTFCYYYYKIFKYVSNECITNCTHRLAVEETYVIALHPCVVQEKEFGVWTRDAVGRKQIISECVSLIFPITHNTLFAIVYSLATNRK